MAGPRAGLPLVASLMRFDIDRRTIRDLELYCQVDPEHYDDLGSYKPRDSIFLDLAINQFPATWILERSRLWYAATPPLHTLPSCGFKIHVSAVPNNSLSILERVLAIAIRHECACKFLVDRNLIAIAIDKNSVTYPHYNLNLLTFFN
jgi:hypothetical protein